MKHSNLGLSLIELMIALLVGLILVGGVITLFIETSANIKKTEQVSALSSEGQFALSIMAHDIALAGFWGHAFDPDGIDFDPTVFNNSSPGSTIGTDCGAVVNRSVNGIAAQNLAWAYDIRAGTALAQYDDADGALSGTFPCLADVVADTDVLAIRRVSGGSITAGTGDTNRVYLRANNDEGGLYKDDGGTAPTLASITGLGGAAVDWEYRPMVYFIRDYARAAGDGIPTLCHKVLQGGDPPTFVSECLAEGVEDMQLEFGIDTDVDGVVNYFDPDPTAAELAQTSAVRVHLLVRSTRRHGRFDNDNTYVLGDKTVTVNDNFFREVYSQTVPVRNPTRERFF